MTENTKSPAQRPANRPAKGRRKSRDPVLEQRIDALVRRNGLTRPLAHRVASGQVGLDAVLERMALQARVDSLMRRFELSRALATQIAMEQADLEVVLRKRRMAQHLEQNATRSLLSASVESGEQLYLSLHGQRHLDGAVSEVGSYEFVVDGESIHKLQAKWGVGAADKKKARRALSWNKERKASPAEPVWKPQERYTCSNRRLFYLLDDKSRVEISLLEGEVFVGSLSWVGRFELGLLVKGGVELVIFRHAMERLREQE